MYCLVTRIKVARLFTLIGIIVTFLRMRRRARAVRGLLEISILIRRQRTVYLISLWEDVAAMAAFATAIPEHPMVVYKMRRAKAEIWSGHFELRGISPHSKPWTKIHVDASFLSERNDVDAHP
jgi:hypothetical protein